MKPRQAHKKASSDWHSADIKAALEKAGWSLGRLSRQHNLHRTTVRKALAKPYARAERIIAEAIGVEPRVIWPSRYENPRPLAGVGGYPTHKARLKNGA